MASMTIQAFELPDRSAAIVVICGVTLTFHTMPEAVQWIADLTAHHKLTLTRVVQSTAEMKITETVRVTLTPASPDPADTASAG